MTATVPICTFTIGDTLFGLDVDNVQEVIRNLALTPVPLAPKAVKGLVNLRGHVVTAIDMRARLGLDPRVSEEPPANVIAAIAGGLVSFLVDEVGELLDVEQGCFERTPVTLSQSLREVVLGVFKLEGKLLLLLDPEKVAALGNEATHGRRPEEAGRRR